MQELNLFRRPVEFPIVRDEAEEVIKRIAEGILFSTWGGGDFRVSLDVVGRIQPVVLQKKRHQFRHCLDLSFRPVLIVRSSSMRIRIEMFLLNSNSSRVTEKVWLSYLA